MKPKSYGQMTLEQQQKLIGELNQSDLFEFGNPLAGLDPALKVAWDVVGLEADPEDANVLKVTCHGHLFDVFICRAIARVPADTNVPVWSIK
jgi:hypothetical protein